ncbi:MAG: hypothetical protein JWM10_2539 [Myxococcaceae bacterium]|nr:hypothetical protein [Myxococcaceae bacterium]
MTAHVTIASLRDGQTDWQGKLLGKVGDTLTLVVRLWDYATLQGGRFSIKHPAMAPEGQEFVVPRRRPTGQDKEVRKAGKFKTTPEDLAHEDFLDCAVTLTRPCEKNEPFVLTALENCVCVGVVDPALRCVATQLEFDGAMLTLEGGDDILPERTHRLTRAGNAGLSAKVGNTIRTCVRLFASFHFKDPDGDERPFPKGMPVNVLLGDHAQHSLKATIGDDGALTLAVIGHASAVAAKTLALRFGAPTANRVICEAPTQPKAQRQGAEPAATDPAGNYDERFFNWPREWTLRQADWTVTNDDGRWDATPGNLKMTKSGLAASLGHATKRVKFVLDPHWQYLKFEFFDRTYGRSDHGNENKTIPPVVLEAFRFKPSVATAKPEIRSNWWLVDGDKTTQCVPWILQRKPDGVAVARPSPQTQLRFKLAAKSCVHSESATVRKRVIATDEQLKPGPERLKFYDLPVEWGSRNYYAKLSATAGEFGWYDAIAAVPSAKTKPFVFCLDDIVVTDEAGRRLDNWSNNYWCSIFAHTFDDTLPDTTKEGLYKPNTADKFPWYSKTPAAGAPEEAANYIVDYPRWTRMVVANGAACEAFDRRTVASSPAEPDKDVIGARAAVRWVDVNARIGTTQLIHEVSGTWQYTTDHLPAPGRMLYQSTSERIDQPMCSIHPYYSQDYMARFGKYLDAGSTGDIGRFDMLLLRCCNVAQVDGKPVEVAVNFWFHRICFDTTENAPATGSLEDYQVRFVRTVLDRFNGLDAKNGQGRAELLPKDASKPIKVPVVSFIHVSFEEQAHFKIKLTDSSKGGRDNRSQAGLGATGNAAPQDSGTVNGFVNAHEHGHQSAFPDEYNERWDAASYGQASFYSTLPGDPFEMDGRTKEFQVDNSPLMNGNHTFHNRYYWQAAEWVRLATRIGMKVKLGAKYKEYWLPPYPTAHETRRHYGFWPVSPSTNDQVLVARGGLAANRAKLDLYLYALGADSFPIEALPKKEVPAGTEPYDGLLMVTVRLKVNAWGVKKDAADDLKALAHALARVGRRFDSAKTRKLNHAWTIAGMHGRGTPQEWDFQRCLVHFSPRLLISGVAELETADQWDTKVGEFKTETIWTDVKTKLTNYHAIGWDDSGKGARLDTLIGPAAEPTLNPKGNWPGGNQPFDEKLSAYASKPATPVKDRYNAAKAVADYCTAWLNHPQTQAASASVRTKVTELGQRFEEARKKLGALFYVRDLEEKAKDLKKRDKEQEEKVTKVSTAHAPHFTVNCKAGSPPKAEWDPPPIEGDLPTAAEWEALVPAAHRNGVVFNRMKGRIGAYHKKEAHDLAARIKALGELLGPEVIAAEASPRGAWTANGKASLAVIDTQLTTFETTDPEDHAARQLAASGAHAWAVMCDTLEGVGDDDRVAAEALLTRIDATYFKLAYRWQVRSIEARAKGYKEHLERWVASTTVTLTADSADGFEEAMLLAFPSMFGAYTASSTISEDDIKAFASKVGLDGLRVTDLLDSGPPELPTN